MAVQWRVILDMPCRIDLLKTQDLEMEFYEPAVYDNLVKEAAKLGPMEELLVRLGGDAGLRRGELLALKGAHVDRARKMITVSRNEVRGIEVDTKGMEARRLPMGQRLAELLSSTTFKDVQGYLLTNGTEKLTAKTVRTMMGRIEEAAGLGGSGKLHILRHTYCSHLAMAGVPVMEIQKLAGHANLTTTLGYMHLAPSEEHHRAVGMLDKLRAGNSTGASSNFVEE